MAQRQPRPKALNGGNLRQRGTGPNPVKQRQRQTLAKRRSRIRQLTAALESGRAEAKPGAKVELGMGIPIGEAVRAGQAIQRSLRRSAPRRAAARAKARTGGRR